MKKITNQEFLKLIENPETTPDTVLKYLIIKPGKHGTDFTLELDPERTDIPEIDPRIQAELLNGLDFLNKLARNSRHAIFRRRIKKADHPPVLVSEGDSWFQFPCILKEIVDQLKDDYLIWSVGAAGDTAQNMVNGPEKKYHTEYMKELERQKDKVQGFLFSAAGNDVIGEDPDTDRPVLLDILKDFNGDVTDIEGHINFDLLNEKIDDLEMAYNKVIKNIRSNKDFGDIPIFIHGYDYVFPYPWGDDDPRNPNYVANNNWLGKPLDCRKIMDLNLRRGITSYLIDRLYDLLEKISGDSEVTNVWLVNCRKAMDDVSDWNDEIHGTSKGFEKVAERFRTVINDVLQS